MRSSEPLRLHYKDVSLKTGDIYIRNTKKNKDHHIIMSDDMLNLCQRYDTFMESGEYFFYRTEGLPFDTHWMTNHFHICWDKSGFVKHVNPRPYDLRRAFTSRNLIRWIAEGRDAIPMLPHLNIYGEFRDTLYYVHILPESIGASSIQSLKKKNQMKKIKDPTLFRLIKCFLGTCLPSIRQRSGNTVDSYRDVLNIYFLFIQKTKEKHLSDVTITDFSQTNVVAFINWLKNNRQNKPTTINQRLFPYAYLLRISVQKWRDILFLFKRYFRSRKD